MRTKINHQPQLTIRIQLKPRPIFFDLCICAKNLYNRATYEVRQKFFQSGKWLQYTRLYHQLKKEPVYLALKELSDSYLPQQVLRQVEQSLMYYDWIPLFFLHVVYLYNVYIRCYTYN